VIFDYDLQICGKVFISWFVLFGMRNKLAIASLVLVVVNLLLFLLLFFLSLPSIKVVGVFFEYFLFYIFPVVAIISLITSIIAIVKIKKNRLDGMWMAISSLIISIIFLVLYSLLWLYLFTRGF